MIALTFCFALCQAATTSPIHWTSLNEPSCGGAMTSISVSPHESKRILVGGDMLGIGLSEDGGDSWLPTFGLKSYEIGDFSWSPRDPNSVWVGTMSGPAVSHDGGHHWTPKREGFPPISTFSYSAPIEKVLIDPTSASHLIAVGGSSRHWASPGSPKWGVVWSSLDGGEHWAQTSTVGNPGKNIVAAEFGESSKVLYLLADDLGFQRSDDAGRSWHGSISGLPPAGIRRLVVSSRDRRTLWVTTDSWIPKGETTRHAGGVYKSVDGGNTWKDSSQGLGTHVAGDDFNTTSRYEAIAISPKNPDLLYTNDASWATGVIYRSTDGGAHWSAVATKNGDPSVAPNSFHVKTAMPAGVSLTYLTIDPSHPEVAFGVNSEFILRTTDGGKTWSDASSQVIDATAGRERWRGRGYAGWCTTNIAFDPYVKDLSLLQGLDASRMWLSTDGLKSWSYPCATPVPWMGGQDATFAKDGHIYATFGQFGAFSGIGRSVDHGKTWTVLFGASHGLPEATWSNTPEPKGIWADPDHGDHVWVILAGRLFSSKNGGETWAACGKGRDLNYIAGDPTHPGEFYISGQRGVVRTSDGIRLTPIGGPRPAGRICCDRSGRLYAVSFEGNRGGLWRYEKASWHRILNDPAITNVGFDPKDFRRIAVTTASNPYHDESRGTGVWVSGDDGKSWRNENQGLPMLRGQTVAFDPFTPGRIVFGSYGRGFFVTSWPLDYLPKGHKSYVETAEDVDYGEQIEADLEPKVQVLNGSMTLGSEIPDHWTDKWVGHGDVTIRRDTKTFHSAPASLCITGVGDSQAQAYQVVTGSPGQSLRLRGFVRSSGKVKVNVAIQAIGDDWKPISFQQAGYCQNDTDWSPFDRTITLPPKTARFFVVLLLEGSGSAWLDDVVLEGSP